MPHNDVLKAIRKMEPAWEKTCGCKFALTSRTIIQPNGGTREVPCYSLPRGGKKTPSWPPRGEDYKP